MSGDGASVTSASRGLGLAPKTIGGRASALAIYDKWKSYVNESWASMKAELDTYRTLSDGNEQIGDMIKKELLGFSMWIVNEDIKQKGRTDKDLGSSSLMQCFGQVKEVVRDAFPGLPISKDHDETGQWYNVLRQSTSTGVMRRLHQSDDEMTSVKVRPMVRRLEQDLCCLNNCLRLVEKVWTEEEKEVIYRPPLGTDMTKKAELMTAANAIQKRCLSEMIEYEKNAGMEPKTKGSAKHAGLGGRIRAYEKYLKDNPSCGGKSILNSSTS